MKNFILCILFLICIKAGAQLSGSVFLSGQTNHAGIKVKIFANSATAATDSILTAANGTFSMPLSGGIYKIQFSKAGYITHFYNGNGLVTLANPAVLNTATLAAGNAVVVSGTVSGTWSSNNVYFVNGNITVPANNTLVIQPGTLVKFNGDYTLTANGVLLAGAPTGSSVLFTSNQPTLSSADWYGIYLSSNQSKIENCIIEYCKVPITAYYCSPSIFSNVIRFFRYQGISLQFSSSKVYHNEIRDFMDDQYSAGIICYQGTVDIQCNSIFNGQARGISCQSNGLIKNNHIYNMVFNQRGYGIDCPALGNSRLDNNIIHGCIAGIRVGESVAPPPSPLITNNTLYWNSTGIWIDSWYSKPNITNNLITTNTIGIDQFACNTCINNPSVVAYNNVWNNAAANYSNVGIVSLGQTVSVNSNGDPVDPYFNISEDPLYIGNTPPSYGSNSPCRNVGDPAYFTHIGCDLTKLCDDVSVGIIEKATISEMSVYPNPSSNSINFQVYGNSEFLRIQVYDTGGKLVLWKTNPDAETKYTLDISALPTGLYFINLNMQDNTIRSGKFIKN